eukprot:GHUV01057011.1.p1 GENE.GHUV01057011.1~~GHUV01057011.1.p1  ORF type:complete len:259 (-),score=30.67 GHUV01057011.1:351-1127(-)
MFCSFVFDGMRVRPEHTPELMGMEDGEVIDCVLDQHGGGRIVFVDSQFVGQIHRGVTNPSTMIPRLAKTLSQYTTSGESCDIHLCGILGRDMHWVPFVMEYSEASQDEHINVYVIDSGWPSWDSGQWGFVWNGRSNVDDAAYNSLKEERPSYLTELVQVAAWYCRCTNRNRGTNIEINIEGTGKQLYPDSRVYDDCWSCGRWAVTNLGILIARVVFGLSTKRVDPNLEEVQNVAMLLAELRCCSYPSLGLTTLETDSD